MSNTPPSQPGHSWQTTVLSTAVFTCVLGLVATRIDLASPFSRLPQLTILAGISLLVVGLPVSTVRVSRLSELLHSLAGIRRLPQALIRALGLLVLNTPLILLVCVILSQPATSDLPALPATQPADAGHSQPSDYDALVERAQTNASFLPRLQYTMANEAQAQDSLSAALEQAPPDTALDPATLQAGWPAFLQAHQRQAVGLFNLDAFDLDAPLEVVLHNTLEQHFENATYTIEVLTWQAAPGIYMPAVVYRPTGLSGRLPVVITPPACHEDVASRRPESSMQRRMANFALSGMIAFTTEGFCANGIIKDVPGNERRFDYYTIASGSGISTVSLELVVWLRALDYLETRADTDMSRVGVTGYSNGAAITKHLAKITDRIAAVAVVSSGLPETSDSDFYSDVRDNNNFFTKPSTFYNGAHMASPFQADPLNVDEAFATALSGRWSRDALTLALDYGAPRPVYFVLGSQDSHYSILDAENAVEQMQQPWIDLGASVLPALDVVDAVHGYNAEHQRLVTQWFIGVLGASPVLPPPDRDEYETAILDQDLLEITPAQYPGITLHDLYSGLALETIAARRAEFPLTALTPGEAEQRVESLLGLSELAPDAAPRPILLDDTAMNFHGSLVRFQYWLVGRTPYLRTGLMLIYDESHPATGGAVDLMVSTNDLVPPESVLQDALMDGRIVAVVIVPGFGPAASSQSTTGNLAREQAHDLTLLGMGVAGVERSVDLLQSLWPGAALSLHAHEVDAGNIAYFALALDERVSAVWVTQGLSSFESILTAPTQPYVPPTLVIPGILAEVSVDDLRWLASPREIHILSESDLSEFHPDRP